MTHVDKSPFLRLANGWLFLLRSRHGAVCGLPPPEEAHTKMLGGRWMSPPAWATEEVLWQEWQMTATPEVRRRNLLMVIWHAAQFPPVRTGFQL
jgi:hypothetical protein